MTECKQISTAEDPLQAAKNPGQLGDRRTPHENKNLTNKQNAEEKIFGRIFAKDNKPPSSALHKYKKNRRVRWESPSQRVSFLRGF
jgi:hypothetical protein